MKNKKGSTEYFCESMCRPFDRLHVSHSSKRKIYLSRQFTDNSQTDRRSQICFSRIPPEISPDSLIKVLARPKNLWYTSKAYKKTRLPIPRTVLIRGWVSEEA